MDRDTEKLEKLEEFAKNLVDNMVDIDEDFQKVIDDNFWDLVGD